MYDARGVLVLWNFIYLGYNQASSFINLVKKGCNERGCYFMFNNSTVEIVANGEVDTE